MYINFDDSRPDTPRLDRSLTRLEQILLTLLMYACLIILFLAWPHLSFVKAMEAAQKAKIEEALRRQEELRKTTQFVFSVPKSEMQKPPQRPPDLSDETHRAQTMERVLEPKNDRPLSRGNSPDEIAAANRPAPQPNQQQPQGQPAPPNQADGNPNAFQLPKVAESTIARNEPSKNPTLRGPAAGVLSDAIRHVDRYTQGQTLQNPQGGGDYGPSFQFDSKGVDFGWWLRRFKAQVYRNWFIPTAAMSLHGHVVLSFVVHKDGAISDLQIMQPSPIDSFTKAAYNAIRSSNPTVALPPEFPDEAMPMTVIFYYNEMPPGGYDR
jgi:TonB family protein